ncbi:MAG: glycosyltransferase [Bacteroidales bacterium]|jgi:glycosyltransferase involved in cell wall biosynthesis|nr:glycosyltransferase [Bacteroidales bacterium]
MYKIVRILNRFNVGGPTYNVAYLSKYIGDDFETVLIGGEKNESEASSEYILDDLDLSYTIMPQMRRSINPFQDILALWHIIKIIRRHKPDIVHTHAAKAGTLGRIAAILCGVPIIVHTFHGHVFHSYFSTWKTKIFLIIERFLAKKSTVIIAISDIQKKELGEEYRICNPDKIHVIPLGFKLNSFIEGIPKKRHTFRETYQFSENTIVVGIVGRLVPVKNHELFLQAFQHCVRHTQKDIRACIVGDGELKEYLYSVCESLGLSYATPERAYNGESVIFTSWIQEVDEVYAGVDVVCLTSKNEGTPVSLIEAQASGKPIVSTNVGGIENIVEEGKTALLSENNESDFSQKLLHIIEDDVLRTNMSSYASDVIVSKFDYPTLCTNMNRLYNKLLKKQLE